MLALAEALKPGDGAVAAFLNHFAKDIPQAAGGPGETVTRARTRAWQILVWLEANEAANDARALAACLGDVLAAADPKHPRAAELAKQGERGAWADWVKPRDAFTAKKALVQTDSPGPPPKPAPPPAATDPPPPPPPPAVKLSAAKVTTIVRARPDPDAATRLMPMALKVTAAPPASGQEPRRGVTCKWENPNAGDKVWEEHDIFRQASQTACEAVTGLLGPLPNGIRLTFRPEGKATYHLAKNTTALSAPLAVLVHAAISGIEPQGAVLGEIDRNGDFKLPADFWARLRAFSGVGGGRLVLPLEAIHYLPSVLTLEDPGFFLDYEVLLAANLKEVVERSALQPATPLAEITARFAEIRGRRGTQHASPYVASRDIRSSLEDIGRAAPYHASARMLVIQGSGERSTRLPAPILASELLQITGTTNWITAAEADAPDPDALGKLSDAGRDALRNLERSVETRDRPLLDAANDLILGVRTLARAYRKRSYDPNQPDGDNTDTVRAPALARFKDLHARVTELLKVAAAAPLVP
jgi:hypothetical protein